MGGNGEQGAAPCHDSSSVVTPPLAVVTHENSPKDEKPAALMETDGRDGHKSDSGIHSVRQHGHESHSHAEQPPLLITAVVSGIINWLLMFGLCCAFGMVLFSDPWHESHRALGVKMNLSTACFVGLALAGLSKVPVTIGGPDLNPTVFLAGFVEIIGLSIADQLELDHPSAARRLGLEGSVRRLGGSSGASDSWFCVDEHLDSYRDKCADYQDQVRATVIFTTAVSSAIIAVVFFCLGQFKLTRFASYVPMSVMEAFLSCVGYKVFKYGLKFSEFEPMQFIPAGILGVTMYFVKAQHIGHPAVMIPLIMLAPLAVFYAAVFGSGHDIEWARNEGYMFPDMPDVEFWSVWTESIGKLDKINMTAWAKTLPELVTMVVVVVLDCLLKMLGTEAKLKLKVDKDEETKLYAAANVVSMSFAGAVGYMQLKFNVINSGVMGNLVDRRGGVVYAVLCGAGFFGTIQLFNFMPRFFLSMLLFFAGAGFVAENLWGSRMYMNIREWTQVITILAVFIVSESMLYAVMVGGLLTCADFLVSYANVPCVLGRPLRGGELTSADRHHPTVHRALQHLTNTWCIIIRLKGFVFFGSSQKVVAYIKGLVQAQKRLPNYRRLRFVILDCKLLDGMDASASKALKKVKDEALELDILILWSHARPKLVEDLKMRSLVECDADWFNDLNHAILYVEGLAYQFLHEKQQQWLRVHPAFALYYRQRNLQASHDPFQNVLTMDTMRHGCPWGFCSRTRHVKKKTVLWKPGQVNVDMYLVHTGSVGVFQKMPDAKDPGSWDSPLAVYRHGWFLNGQMLVKGRTEHYAVAMEDGEALSWSEGQWYNMMHSQPAMASAIARQVKLQESYDWGLFRMHADRTVPEEEEEGQYEVSSKERQESAEIADIPELAQFHFDAIKTAQVLEEYGLYAEPADASSEKLPFESGFPQLPSHLHRDLELAFNTYAVAPEEPGSSSSKLPVPPLPLDAGSDMVTPPSSFRVKLMSDATEFTDPQSAGNPAASPKLSPRSCQGDRRYIPGPRVAQALAYAGYARVLLPVEPPNVESVTQFKDVARNAVLAALDETQLQKIRQVFKGYDADGSGSLDMSELGVVLRETFHPLLSIEEAVSISRFWDADGSGKIDIHEFTQLVSRFTRVHEPEWCFTMALKELCGKGGAVTQSDRITVEALKRASHHTFSDDCMEEMIWAADWSSGGAGNGLHVPAWDIITVLLMGLGDVTGRLPPEPKRDPPVEESASDLELARMAPVLAVSGVYLQCRTDEQCVPLDNTIRALDLRSESVRQALWTQEGQGRTTVCRGDQELHLLCIAASMGLGEGSMPVAGKGERSATRVASLSRALTDPKTSWLAKLYFHAMLVLIVLALAALVVEPLLDSESDVAYVFLGIEVLVTAAFSLDLGMRMYTSLALGRTLRAFFSTTDNLCDAISVLPLFLDLLVPEGKDAFDIIRISRLVRAVRAIRLLRARAEGLMSAIFAVLAVIWGIYLKSK